MVAPGDVYEATIEKSADGKLGLTIRRAQVDGGQCLVVSNVADDGPAAAAGVHKGSLVLEVNGEAVVFAGSDPFSVLGVAPDEDAAGVRRAWREKVLLLHPDKGGDAASWHTIKAAYEVLRDERSRKRASTCRVGAVANWDLAVRLIAATSSVRVKLLLPPLCAPTPASVDVDSDLTASPTKPRKGTLDEGLSDAASTDAAVGEFGFDDAPPIDRRDGGVSWHSVFDASPEHDDGVSGAPFACLSTALAACYGGEVVEGEDRPVEYVDERPLAPPAAPDAWRAAILADRGEGPKPKTIHVDVARSASPDASPAASPPSIPRFTSPGPLRCLLANAAQLEASLATQAEATAQAARSAEHAAASADANAAAARRACDEARASATMSRDV
ncbi:hypothetical protein JL721_9638 [Aureococcus anophagefferens]|nr:hypothetical protein JL721_9638 [Aureococcus anophagefferens]